jgi:type IV pilus assembly protein PilQ
MKKDQMNKIVWLLAITAGISCGEKKPPASVADAGDAPVTATEIAPDPSGLNVLSIIDVQGQSAGGSKIVLTGTKPMSPNIFKLTEPDRIVVDLTDTKVGNVSADTNVDDASVQNIKVEQFDDAQSSLSRVEIVLKAPAEYQVESNGNAIALNIGQMDMVSSLEPVAPVAPAADSSLAGEQVFSVGGEASQDPFALSNQQEGISTQDLEQTLSNPVGAVDTGIAKATSLTEVNYAASSEGTVVILTGNGNFEGVENTSLENPNRIVVDLKDIRKDYKGSSKIKLNTSEVTNIRVGESAGNIRVVLDLKGKAIPQYRVDNVDGKITITVPGPENFVTETVAEASVEPAPPETFVEAPVESFTPPSVANVDMTEAPVNNRRVVVDKVNFANLSEQGKSRFSIGVNQPDAQFDVQEISDRELKVLIPNSKFKTNVLSKYLDTSEYSSAVKKITPKYDAANRSTEYTITMSEKVNYNIQQTGNSINMDFDIPASLAGGTSSDQTRTNSAVVSETIVPSTETVLSAKGEVKGGVTKKDYRYVKESFMSDSGLDDSPLSQMGAILAGNVSGKKFSGRKISLDFKDADIRSIFRLIADISKFNLIISDDVAGRVTIKLDDVPWDQAFAIILQSKGLWFEKYGNIVRIAPAKRLQEEKESAAAAEQAAQAVKPLDILFKPVSFAQADTLIKQVGTVLTPRGSVDIDSRTNTLIIKDIRENLEKAKRMVDILDTQTPQVSIESRIVEATTTFTRSFGITWGGNTRFTAATGNPTGLYFPNSVAVSPFALNFPVDGGFVNSTANIRLGSINNVLDLDLALALGEQKGYSKLISAPKVTVLDNKAASITSGSRIPFITQTADSGSNVRFENAATTLNVTPHITNDGSILMTITATRNEPNFAQLVQGNPLIDQRTATTEVLVKSGNTTVLGGIYATRTGRSINRLPFLSSVPIIGALFQNYDKQLSRTELLIFVTPRIVGDEREAIRDIRE